VPTCRPRSEAQQRSREVLQPPAVVLSPRQTTCRGAAGLARNLRRERLCCRGCLSSWGGPPALRPLRCWAAQVSTGTCMLRGPAVPPAAPDFRVTQQGVKTRAAGGRHLAELLRPPVPPARAAGRARRADRGPRCAGCRSWGVVAVAIASSRVEDCTEAEREVVEAALVRRCGGWHGARVAVCCPQRSLQRGGSSHDSEQ
jgi:hypothetical protein